MSNNKLISKILLSTFLGLGGLNASAAPLDDMASPVSNPVNFEDPRIESNIKPLYAHHEIDDKFITGGGSVDIYALQIRYALSDRFALIATKDGYVNLRPNSVLDDSEGFANLGGGFKYAFYNCNDSIVTAGLRYEAPTGETEVLQGKGDGVFNPFISAGTVAGPINLIGYTGFRIPISDNDSSFYDASLHADTNLGWISPLFELNLFNVLSAGDRLPIADEGQDFFNIGSSLSEGKTMLTGAVGARIPVSKDISFGAAYEFPIAQGSGTYITDWRVTSDLTVKF